VGHLQGGEKKTQRSVNFRRYQDTEVQLKYKIFNPLLFSIPEFLPSLSQHTIYLEGGNIPLPKNKTETIDRSVGCGTGFWQKGTVHDSEGGQKRGEPA